MFSRAAGSSGEAGRNVEVMWLTGRLVPDHKTIADFRRDNGAAIRRVCARFVELCRSLSLFAETSVAIDGSKFKAVNNRDRNFTRAKMDRRMAQIEASVARYLDQLDSADRQDPSLARESKTVRLKEKIVRLRQEMKRLEALDADLRATPDQHDLAQRSRCPLDGDQWPGVGRGRLQCAGGGRYRASSDYRTRRDQRRQ